MNSIMCCKAWLGVAELPPDDLLAEEQLLAHLNEVTSEGDWPIVIVDDEDED